MTFDAPLSKSTPHAYPFHPAPSCDSLSHLCHLEEEKEGVMRHRLGGERS